MVSGRSSDTVTPDCRSGLHKKFASKVLEKMKLVKNSPKQKTFVFVQTIHKNVEGFTKCEVKEVHLAFKT